MELLAWSPVIVQKRFFKEEDEKNVYVDGNILKESFRNAVIYHSLKTDKKFEKEIRERILSYSPKKKDEVLKELVSMIEKEALDLSRDIIDSISVPETLKVPRTSVREKTFYLYDLKKKEVIKTVKKRVFGGIFSVDVNIEKDMFPHIKSICHSYVEALIHAEITLTRGTHLKEAFYEEISQKVKSWEIPLRMGLWEPSEFKEKLFWFWSNKSIREFVMRKFRIDIRPTEVYVESDDYRVVGYTELRGE